MHTRVLLNVLMLLCLFAGGGASKRCTNPRTSLATDDTMNLTGIWTKLTRSDCGKKYPAQIEFKANDLYSAQADSGATQQPVWDIGTWTIEGNHIKLSTANDAMINYAASLKNDVLTLKDPDGCTFEYRKKA